VPLASTPCLPPPLVAASSVCCTPWDEHIIHSRSWTLHCDHCTVMVVGSTYGRQHYDRCGAARGRGRGLGSGPLQSRGGSNVSNVCSSMVVTEICLPANQR